jgi:hypothetical protein
VQQLLDFFNSSAGGAFIAVIGSIVGFFISFLTQSWLEQQKFARGLKLKAWEAKVERLRQFSEDLELWLYLVTLRSKNTQTAEYTEGFSERGRVVDTAEIIELTKKLIRGKTHLIKFPAIFSAYQKLESLVEWTESSPPYLTKEETTSINNLLKAIQLELQKEIETFY